MNFFKSEKSEVREKKIQNQCKQLNVCFHLFFVIGMGLKHFLVFGIITLSCITILELFYTGFVVVKNFNDFTWSDLLITSLINCCIIFFAVSSIAGVTSENFGLLVTCLIFLLLETIRMIKGFYETWVDDDEKDFNKFFITIDAGKY